MGRSDLFLLTESVWHRQLEIEKEGSNLGLDKEESYLAEKKMGEYRRNGMALNDNQRERWMQIKKSIARLGEECWDAMREEAALKADTLAENKQLNHENSIIN